MARSRAVVRLLVASGTATLLFALVAWPALGTPGNGNGDGSANGNGNANGHAAEAPAPEAGASASNGNGPPAAANADQVRGPNPLSAAALGFPPGNNGTVK